MNNIDNLKKKIMGIISKSSVPEDPIHAINTLEWLLKMDPEADEALRIAALGHDIERAMENRKVRREEFADFIAFKKAHAINSANVLKELMTRYGIDKGLMDDVYGLVCCHETGGDPRSDLLRDADSLSFFHKNLPMFFDREGPERAFERCIWGYERLSPEARDRVKGFSYNNEELSLIVTTVFRKAPNKYSEGVCE